MQHPSLLSYSDARYLHRSLLVSHRMYDIGEATMLSHPAHQQGTRPSDTAAVEPLLAYLPDLQSRACCEPDFHLSQWIAGRCKQEGETGCFPHSCWCCALPVQGEPSRVGAGRTIQSKLPSCSHAHIRTSISATACAYIPAYGHVLAASSVSSGLVLSHHGAGRQLLSGSTKHQ